MQRVFIVGCPRSGTTLVQALLARYPGVQSFPETRFFEALLGGVERRWKDPDAKHDSRWYHRRGFAHAWGRDRLRELESALLGNTRTAPPRMVNACIRRYVALLDRTTQAHGRAIWVEKTPNHLMYIDEIANHLPDARFVHVMRNGEDVVASIIDADLNQPTRAFRGGIKRWVRRWNHAVGVQLACLGDERHHIICLEDMVEDFPREWRRLCAFLGLDSDVPLLPEPCSDIANISTEPWKCHALSGIVQTPARKSDSLFGPLIREWMRTSLHPYADIRAKVASRG